MTLFLILDLGLEGPGVSSIISVWACSCEEHDPYLVATRHLTELSGCCPHRLRLRPFHRINSRDLLWLWPFSLLSAITTSDLNT